ncbi:MAG: ABC transporter permease [Acidimicrobiia bacterium]
MRSIFEIARLEVVTFLRQERVLLTLVALPLFQIGVVLYFPQAVEDRQASREQTARHEVVVDEDAPGDLTEWLQNTPMDVRRVDDPERAVAEGDADAGLSLDGRAAAALRGEATVEAEVYVRISSRSSVAAGTVLGQRMDALATEITRRAAEASGLEPAAVAGASVAIRDVGDTQAGRQASFSLIAPLVLALALSGVTNVAASSLSSTKDARVLEPLLVLPYTRRAIAGGKLVAAFGIGVVQALVVALALGIGAAVTASGTEAVPLSGAAVPQLAVASLVLLAVGAALGVLLGAVARGSAVVTAIAPVGGLVFVIIAFLMRAQGPGWGGSLYAVPGVGALVLAREAVLERLSWADLAFATAVSLAVVVLLTLAAARLLASDRGVLRPTR